MFVPAGEGKKIDERNFVEVMPATIKREEHGFIHGRVVAVSELPATRLAMEAALQHPDLVDAFLKRYAPGVLLRVHVKLEQVPALVLAEGTESTPPTRNLYRWSSSSGIGTAAQDRHHVRGRDRRRGAAVDHARSPVDQEDPGDAVNESSSRILWTRRSPARPGADAGDLGLVQSGSHASPLESGARPVPSASCLSQSGPRAVPSAGSSPRVPSPVTKIRRTR